MGLDWIAAAKRGPNGEEIDPQKTLGMKRLSREDPETIEAMKAVIKSHRKAIKEQPSPMPAYEEHWTRTDDAIIDEYINRDGGAPYIDVPSVTPPKDIGGSGSFMSACDATTWRGKMLRFVGLPVEEAGRAYGFGDENTIEPDTALKYADDLEVFAQDPTQLSVESEALDDAKQILEAAIRYLRFWGNHGHPIFCWY